jgi:tetraacyldisaccharide 4'-kinase
MYLVLLPLGWLYAALVAIRRRLFQAGILRTFRLGVPVIVVGNLTAGGTGKTPVTIWLVAALRERGLRAGVVSRGYRGKTGASPLPVMAHSDPAVVGDEPVLIASRSDCPVVVHPDRVRAARVLEEQGVDIIVADDGLQHYRLERDFEIVVVDGRRGFGNAQPLPAGPLREPVARLRHVDQVVINADDSTSRTLVPAGEVAVSQFRLRAAVAVKLADQESCPLTELSGRAVHAVAAIGNPERFFDMLSNIGLVVTPHPFSDHAALTPDDLAFGDDRMIVMTEKDAVKCRHLELPNLWYVPVDVDMPDDGWVDQVAALAGQTGQRTTGANQDD